MFGTANLGEQALNKIAELAFSSQLEDSDSLQVKIDTSPEKLANGELESLSIEGVGLDSGISRQSWKNARFA